MSTKISPLSPGNAGLNAKMNSLSLQPVYETGWHDACQTMIGVVEEVLKHTWGDKYVDEAMDEIKLALGIE